MDPTLTEPVRDLLLKLADECFTLAGFDPKNYPRRRYEAMKPTDPVAAARVLESLGSYLSCMADDIRSSDPATHAQTLTGLVGNLARDCRLPDDSAQPIFALVNAMMGQRVDTGSLRRRDPAAALAATVDEVMRELEDAGIPAKVINAGAPDSHPVLLRVEISGGPTLILDSGNGEWSGYLEGKAPYATEVPQDWPEWEPEALPIDADAEDVARVLVDGYRLYLDIADARRKARLALRTLVDAAGVLGEQWDRLNAASPSTELSAGYPFAKDFDAVVHDLITWRDRNI